MRNLFVISLTALSVAACGQNSDPHDTSPITPSSIATDERPTENEPRQAPAIRTSEEQEIFRQAEEHVHGAAELAMALDGSTLSVVFESPLFNLVGFERAPATEEEESALSAVRERLADGASLFIMNEDAKCEEESGASQVGISTPVDSTEHDDHNHDDDHDEDHDDADHDHEEGHADVIVEYTFSCETPRRLDRIEIGLFDAFPGLEEIETIYLGPDKQSAITLSPGVSIVDLR